MNRLRLALHGCPVCGRWFLLRRGRHLGFCRYGQEQLRRDYGEPM